jgi:hypothetical protein
VVSDGYGECTVFEIWLFASLLDVPILNYLLTYIFHAAQSSMRSHPVLIYLRFTSHFMENDGSSTCSQQPDNCSLSYPYQSSPCYHLFQFLKIHFNIIVYKTSRPFPSIRSFQRSVQARGTSISVVTTAVPT